MTQQVLNEVIEKASTDPSFKQQLIADPDAALAVYEGRLDDDEREALRSLGSDPIPLVRLVGDRAPAGRWWRPFLPTSFKELGGSILSLVLMVAFLLVLGLVLTRVGSDPRGVTVGDTTTPVDEFARAKDLLAIVLPLFGAVVTFWLGVAVEGRRADEHKETAREAETARDDAQSSERRKTAVATGALSEINQVLRPLLASGGEGRTRGLGEQPVDRQQLQELANLVEDTRRRLES